MTSMTTQRYREDRLAPGERPVKRYTYYVTGSGYFPVDMLRYDKCWPSTGDDAVSIEWPRNEEPRKLRTVRLTSFSPPTVGRWTSFMWSVSPEYPDALR